ncbi:MAG TPA: hypothetical protein VN518_00250, partial [Methyloceanibacter sp.]|nr:hypothetical protein [Methyloceanibacter sp.]
QSKTILRPGDLISFSGTAWDPNNNPIRWQVRIVGRPFNEYQTLDALTNWEWRVEERDIGEPAMIEIGVISSKPYHRYGNRDDYISIMYQVLPPRL